MDIRLRRLITDSRKIVCTLWSELGGGLRVQTPGNKFIVVIAVYKCI